MANENGKKLAELGTETGKSNATETGGRGKQSTKNPGTTTPKDGGTATGTNPAGDSNTGGEKEKLIPELAILKEEKTEAPKPKPAKKKRKKVVKKNDSTFNAEQITAIIMTLSAVMSQSETGKIFTLSELEAKQIAEPLANIIAKNDAFAGLSEHADSVALVSACFMIFIPKIFVYLTYQKALRDSRKKNQVFIKGANENANNKTRTDNRNSRNDDGQTPGNGNNSGESVLSELPAFA